MSNFGKSVEIDRIIDDDGMYLTLEEFKIVMQYLITSLIFNSISFDMLSINSNPIRSITSSIEVLKREVVDKRNIAFEDIGFVFYENEEGAAVSPEFVLLQTMENVKKNPKKIALLYGLLRNRVGKDNLSNIDLKKVYEELKNEKQTKSKETKGLYRLEFDYPIEYLRGVEVSYKLDSVIDEFISSILDYFCDDFNEFSDPEYLKVEDKIDSMYQKCSKKNYYKTQEKVYDMRDKAKEEAVKRYKNKLFNNQKIAVSELVRLLIDKLKSNIIGYDYEEALTRNGYLTELGIDEVLYFAHPADKYDYDRRTFAIENPCGQDYDEYYVEREENKKENDDDGEISVVRKIYM